MTRLTEFNARALRVITSVARKSGPLAATVRAASTLTRTSWAANREAVAAAKGPPMRGRACHNVATMHQIIDAAEAIIARRTGVDRISGVIDVPALDDVLKLDDEARETWLDEPETRP